MESPCTPELQAISVIGINADSAEITRKPFEVEPDQEPEIELFVAPIEDLKVVNVRVRLTHSNPEMRIAVDVVGQYSAEGFPELPSDGALEFISSSAFPAIYPFVVEVFRNTAMRLPGEAPLIALTPPATNFS